MSQRDAEPLRDVKVFVGDKELEVTSFEAIDTRDCPGLAVALGPSSCMELAAMDHMIRRPIVPMRRIASTTPVIVGRVGARTLRKALKNRGK